VGNCYIGFVTFFCLYAIGSRDGNAAGLFPWKLSLSLYTLT